MYGGSKFLASAAVLTLAGCGGSEGKLQIRPISAPLSASAKPVPARIAEANGHLALGNVGLALELYRKALRDQPESIEAMVGLADSYDRMSRFDLSRRYYETALSIAPADSGVLNAFARSLELQGRSAEAASVRREIGVRLATAKPPLPTLVSTPARPMAVAHAPVHTAGPSVTVALPAPRTMSAAPAKVTAVKANPAPVRQEAAAPASKPATVALAPVAIPVIAARPKPVRQTAAAPAPAPRSVELALATAPVVAAKPKPVHPVAASPAPIASRAATVALPFPQPAATAAAVASMTPFVPGAAAPAATPRAPAPEAPRVRVSAPKAPLVAVPAAPTPAVAPIVVPVRIANPVAAPVPPAPVAIARHDPIEALPSLQAPTRLERLSPGEVVLVTTSKPRWRSQVVGRTAQSTTIRYVPLRTAEVRMAQIRLLNAARHQGLAARTRSLLANRGWRQMAIGDATRVRRTSLILYPPNRRSTAERLAKQFGFPIEKRASGTEFVMLIGQDATRIAGARTRG